MAGRNPFNPFKARDPRRAGRDQYIPPKPASSSPSAAELARAARLELARLQGTLPGLDTPAPTPKRRGRAVDGPRPDNWPVGWDWPPPPPR